ncbi:unannotated protein [freshwater metagenome]|uniref:Unannotated protein n=1 Tax=freshwater metagenome TaxID=449393 RepID=A0A6J6FHS8_9ZZZZ
MQIGAPAHEVLLIRLVPKSGDGGAEQQMLREAHLGMRRHFKRTQLDEAEAAGAAAGIKHLVDAELRAVRVARGIAEDVAEDAIDEPRRRRASLVILLLQLAEGQLKLKQRVIACLIDTRALAGGADEEAAEEVAEAGMVVPVAEQRFEQVGPAQEGRVFRSLTADDDVIAAAGAGVAAIDHEFLRAEPREPRLLVKGLGVVHEFVPLLHGMHVHLDHAGVRRDFDHLKARIIRRRRAFDDDRHFQSGGNIFDGGDEVEIVLRGHHRRHEDMQAAVSRLETDRGADDPARGLLRHREARLQIAECIVIAAQIGRQRLDLAALGLALAAVLAGDVVGSRGGWFRRSLHAVEPVGDGAEEVLAVLRTLRQVRPVAHRIGGIDPRIVGGRHPGQAVERQAQAHRRIAGDEIHRVVSHEPRTALPAHLAADLIALQRQNEAGHLVEPLLEDAGETLALEGIFEVRLERIDIHRQALLLPKIVKGIFIGRFEPFRIDAERGAQCEAEAIRLILRVTIAARLIGDERVIRPHRRTILAPVAAECPAWQWLARIPFALAVVQQAALSKLMAQALDELAAQETLLRTHRGGVPLLAVHVVDAYKGRLAAHRHAHIAFDEITVDLQAELFDLRPLLRRVGLRHTRRFKDARDLNLVLELHLTRVERTGDRCGAGRIWCGSQRQMPLAREQARGRIEAHPACAGQIHLAPGMQVREVHLRAAGAVERFHIRLQLDQIAAHESRGHAEMAEELAKQPRRVTARAAAKIQRLLRRLNARLEADHVADVLPEQLIDRHEEVDRARARAAFILRGRHHACFGQNAMRMRVRRLRVRCARMRQVGIFEQITPDAAQVLPQCRSERHLAMIRLQLVSQHRVVFEGHSLRLRFQEEVERIVHRHLRHQIYFHAELRRFLRKHQTREVVRLRVLLPVDEMLAGRDLQRVAQHWRAAVRRRPQTDDLRTQRNRPVVFVCGDMAESDVDGHGLGLPF